MTSDINRNRIMSSRRKKKQCIPTKKQLDAEQRLSELYADPKTREEFLQMAKKFFGPEIGTDYD